MRIDLEVTENILQLEAEQRETLRKQELNLGTAKHWYHSIQLNSIIQSVLY